MFRLCRCLIRSRLRYGSFICASACKRILSVLDPIHNSALSLCTGAFRTSKVEGLYAESGEPAFATIRHILLRHRPLRLYQGMYTSRHPSKALYRDVHTHYADYTVVFTDGSATNGSTGCVFIVNETL
jgi:hypothetical protein